MNFPKRALQLAIFILHGCGNGTQSVPIPVPNNPTVNDFIEIMNAHRVNIGCPELIWDAVLAGVAQGHSEDMEENNYFDHTNLQGQSLFDRMDANDIEYISAGENIALDGGGGQSVFNIWMNSPGHKANIENCLYTHHGVGLSGSYWTHMFMIPN
jgi:uncharacterized protein YkwD